MAGGCHCGVMLSQTGSDVSSEVSQMSTSIGLCCGAVCILQRILQAAARVIAWLPQFWRWEEGSGGTDFHLGWCFSPGTSLHSSHYITSYLPPQATMLCLSFHVQTSHYSGSYSLTHFLSPNIWAYRQAAQAPLPFPTFCPISSKTSIIAQVSVETQSSIAGKS